MTVENFAMFYYFAGVFYSLFNGIIRKVETDGNPFQAFSWFLLWPIYLFALIFRTIYRKIKVLFSN